MELEEGKVLRMQLELTQIKGEAERRYQEREEEFEASRKNHQRQLESVQASIEAEIRSKTEQARLRKKAEKDLSDAEVGLENEKRAHQETLKNLKKLQQALKVRCSYLYVIKYKDKAKELKKFHKSIDLSLE